MPEIRTETKDNGSRSQYLDVGHYEEDAFGDQVFRRQGYVRQFPGLAVQRKTAGRGAGQRTRWLISVPDDFAYTIRRVTNPGGASPRKREETLYSPPVAG